jgi:glycosyltransferase involved in cell wall biosynthesis
VTRFIAVSQATASQFVEAGFDPASISVVYNGIDVDEYSPGDDRESTRRELGIAADDYVVMYAGRMSSVKNHSLLIQAFAKLADSVPGSWLLMVGETSEHADSSIVTPYVQELLALAHSVGIAGRVKWLGKRHDLPRLYRASDVLVLPSSFQEPFGRTLVEAMACGTPAVGTRVGGIPEVLSGEFAKNCVNPGDSQSLAARLLILRDWRERDPGLALRCRAHVAGGFSLERTIDGVDKVLREVAGMGPARSGPSAKALRNWRGHYS